MQGSSTKPPLILLTVVASIASESIYTKYKIDPSLVGNQLKHPHETKGDRGSVIGVKAQPETQLALLRFPSRLVSCWEGSIYVSQNKVVTNTRCWAS